MLTLQEVREAITEAAVTAVSVGHEWITLQGIVGFLSTDQLSDSTTYCPITPKKISVAALGLGAATHLSLHLNFLKCNQ